MKNLISTTLLLITFLGSNLNAQQISSANYNKEFIHEDFSQEGEYFKIVTTTDNYFIIDKGDYLLSRNNNESEYAIIANKSSVSNFILKTAVRLGPSNNKKSSIGIVLKAQQDGKGAIIFEINKKGEYRIKQLLGNTYKTLSGRSKHEGWVKSKTINGVDEHNFIEIRSENNIYDIYVNSDYLTTFFIPDYTNGSCGLIISPETKARVAYYHINTKGESTTPTTSYADENTSNTNTSIEELNKKITTLEINNATLNNLNTEARGNQDKKINNLTQKNTDLDAVTIKQEKELKTTNNKLLKIQNEGDSLNVIINVNVMYLEKTIQELKEANRKVESNNKEIEGLEKTISYNTAFINNLNTEKNTFTNDVATLTETTNRLNTKNTELASVTIEQEKEIADLKSKNTDATASNTGLSVKVAALKEKITIEQSKSTALTADLNKVNKSSAKRITQLTTEINLLQSAKTTLTTDLTKEKNAHTQTKNGLSKSISNKIAEIKELTTELNNAKQQLKSTNKTSANLKDCATNSANLSAGLKQANNELNTLRKMQAQHDEATTDLNAKITDLNSKVDALNNRLSNANTKLIALNITNVELKELFILKDFEVNGVKPSELTKQTNTYPSPKELKGNSTIYAVQFGVFMQVQMQSTLKELDDIWYETTEQGTYVYLSGEFKNPQEATLHKNKVAALGYPNAFVVTLTK